MSRAVQPPHSARDRNAHSIAGVYARPQARAAEIRQRMKAWGEAVVPRLRALGLDVASCAGRHDRRERLVFEPDGRLSLTVEADSVEVALELDPRDVADIQTRLADPERALELTTAIEAMPEQFAMGVADDGPRLPVAGASADGVRALFERASLGPSAVWIGWTVPRDVAIEHAALLDEQLEDALVVLGGMLALVAWAPAAAGAGDARPHRRRHPGRDERETHRKKPKREARARGREREHERDGEVEADSEQAADGEASAARPVRAGGRDLKLKLPPRPGLRRRATPAVGPVEKGARVRVLEGPFAGKVGVVQELDGKGAARVMLGLLAVRIDVKDLVAWTEGHARPLLSSSHRRPLPVRS